MALDIQSTKKKAIASKAVLTGQAEKLRLDALAGGAVPWSILSYKRVVDPAKVPLPLRVSDFTQPDLFEKQCKYLATKCRPLALSRLIELIDDNQPIPERAVVVTLDGGHIDNYLQAFPVLLKYQVPATFFLPTHYIGNNEFFYDQRLVVYLSRMEKLGMVLPDMGFLDEDLQKRIIEISPDGLVREDLIYNLVEGLHLASPLQRIEMMLILSEQMEKLGGMPEYEDFMRWDDVRHIQSMGFTVGSMGHASVSLPTVSSADFIADLGVSLKKLEDEEINPEKCVNMNYTALGGDLIEGLGRLGCRYATTNGAFLEPRFQTLLPMLLGRTEMSQFHSPTLDIFICRLWRLEISGIAY